MHRKASFFATFFSVSLLFLFLYSCTKLDTTSIGGDLIPEVDNINTFADTLDVYTTQGVFEGIYKDTTKLSYAENYAIGKINDPLMGATNASLYLQLKPAFYPFFIGKIAKDTIVQADSVVLCLSYKAFWGDTLQPLQLQAFEVDPNAGGLWDSAYAKRDINYAPILRNSISSIQSFDLRNMSKYVKVGKTDSVNNQIRIKLSDTYRNYFFGGDTIPTSNNAFRNDSLFRRYINGFAVVASGGNALAYVDLLDATTRLEFHYKRKNGGAVDTTYSNLYFNVGLNGEVVRWGAVANKVTRTRNPLPNGNQELYLQTNPGTFANLYIQGLSSLTNRIVHRAELQVTQIPDPSTDKVFSPPLYMYMDLVDSGTNKWKPIYFDLNPSTFYDPDNKTPGYPYFPYNGNVDVNYFGGYYKEKTDIAGTRGYYNFNITRYVQQMATKHTTNYQMRMFPANNFSYPQYGPVSIPYKNPIAYGRVKVGGGNHPNPTYKMRLRIIYSKIP